MKPWREARATCTSEIERGSALEENGLVQERRFENQRPDEKAGHPGALRKRSGRRSRPPRAAQARPVAGPRALRREATRRSRTGAARARAVPEYRAERARR